MTGPLGVDREPAVTGHSSGEPEGTILGAVLALTLYGAFVIIADLGFGVLLVPKGGLLGLLIFVLLAAGAAVGFVIDQAIARR